MSMNLFKKTTAIMAAGVLIATMQFSASSADLVVGDNLFSEDFESGLEGWSVTDKCTIVEDGSNKAFSVSAPSGKSTISVNNEFKGKNYRISSRIKPASTLGLFSGGLVFRYESDSDFLMFRFAGNASYNKGFELYKWQGGSATLLTSKIMNDFSSDKWYNVQIDVIEDYVFIYVDGVPIFDGFYMGDSPSSGGIGARVYAGTIYVDDISVTEIEYPEGTEYIERISSANLMPENNWESCDALNYDGVKDVLVSSKRNSSATWSGYPYGVEQDEKATYAIYTWVPENGEAFLKFTINTSEGTWTRYIDQSSNKGSWVRVAAVKAMADTVFTVQMSSIEDKNTYATAVKYIKDISAADEPDAINSETDTETVAVLMNQSGFDTQSPKRATITNVADGTDFYIIDKKNNQTVFTSKVYGSIADFSDFTPDGVGEYYIKCGDVVSYDFTIAKNYIERISVPPALDFMAQSRADIWERGRKGVGWRDSHQFSFELNSLVLQYMSNPALYENLPYDIYRVGDTEFENLRVQKEPDIVWLMKFAAEIYYKNHVIDGYNLHPLIKEQMAYFLYIYPYISEYVSYDDYVKFRDMTIDVWGNSDKSNCYNVHYPTSGENYNLFDVQTAVGNIKGSYPPGHSILPNLLMYEVLKRDGLDGADKYFDAAYNNCEYVINSKDITSPQLSKGQRMSERVLMEGLSYFLKMYPDKAPDGLKSEIERWAAKMISRSDNMWDMRMASSLKAGDAKDFWTGAAYAVDMGQTDGIMNEPGNEIGFQAASYAAAMVLDDESRAERLKEIGDAGRDNMFGRNPLGKMYFHDAVRDIEGADIGWPTKFPEVGCGVLGDVVGRIDASPKEDAYPFNPDAGLGYVEGWVAFNTAWNDAIAYSSADNTGISIDKTDAVSGEKINVRLKAPINIDYDTVESAFVYVTDDKGITSKLNLNEENADSYYFTGEYTVPYGVNSLTFSYGIGHFEKSAVLNVDSVKSITVQDFNVDGNNVTASFLGTNNDVYIMVAAYNNDKITELKYENISVNGNYELNTSITSEYTNVKLFVWDKQMTPFTTHLSYEKK